MQIDSNLYDNWNTTKKNLALVDRQVLFKESEVWWCSMGLNIGTETYGKGPGFKRPILIFKKLSTESCLILPITSKVKNGDWFTEVTILNEKRWIMLYQIRMINIKRLESRIDTICEFDFKKVKKELEQLLKF